MAVSVTISARNDNPGTIWNCLAARLGREPTNAEAREECQRIMRGDPAPAMVPQPCQQQQACAARVRPPVNVHVEIDAIRAGVMWRGLWLKMDELQAEHDRVHFERRARYAVISEMAAVANLAREICELAGMDEAGLDAMLRDYSL